MSDVCMIVQLPLTVILNIMLVSAIYQHESAIGIHISPSSWTCLPPHFTPLGCRRTPDLSSLHHTEHFHQLYANLCAHAAFSICTPSASPTMPTSLFSMPASPLLPCKVAHQIHLARFHKYALIHNTCFSVSDSLHSVQQALLPSTSLGLPQMCSFKG